MFLSSAGYQSPAQAKRNFWPELRRPLNIGIKFLSLIFLADATGDG